MGVYLEGRFMETLNTKPQIVVSIFYFPLSQYNSNVMPDTAEC